MDCAGCRVQLWKWSTAILVASGELSCNAWNLPFFLYSWQCVMNVWIYRYLPLCSCRVNSPCDVADADAEDERCRVVSREHHCWSNELVPLLVVVFVVQVPWDGMVQWRGREPLWATPTHPNKANIIRQWHHACFVVTRVTLSLMYELHLGSTRWRALRRSSWNIDFISNPGLKKKTAHSNSPLGWTVRFCGSDELMIMIFWKRKARPTELHQCGLLNSPISFFLSWHL